MAKDMMTRHSGQQVGGVIDPADSARTASRSPKPAGRRSTGSQAGPASFSLPAGSESQPMSTKAFGPVTHFLGYMRLNRVKSSWI